MNIILAQNLFFSALAILGAGAIVSVCFGKYGMAARVISSASAALGSLAGLLSGSIFLISETSFKINLASS